MEPPNTASIAPECPLTPAKVTLIHGSKMKRVEAHLLLGIDLWWLKGPNGCRCMKGYGMDERLSPSGFRKNYRERCRIKKGKGYVELERGVTHIECTPSSGTSSTDMKRVIIRHDKERDPILVFECNFPQADNLSRALKNRTACWKDLVCGKDQSDEQTQSEAGKLLMAFETALQLNSAEVCSSRAAENTREAAQAGSLSIQTVARVVKLFGDLHKPFKEFAAGLSALKEPAKVLSVMPLIGGGLELMANVLDLGVAVAKNKEDRGELDEEMRTFVKRLVETLNRLCTNDRLLEISSVLSKLEKELRRLEHYDLQRSSSQVCDEFLKRDGPTKVLNSIKEISLELTKIEVHNAHEETLRMAQKILDIRKKAHDEATCRRPLCDEPICEKREKSTLTKEFQVPDAPPHTQLNFENDERPEKLVKNKLLSDQPSRAMVTVGLRGMGGAGKTTCLIGIANCQEVKDKFKDGILWIQLWEGAAENRIRQVFTNILKYGHYFWDRPAPRIALHPDTPLGDVANSATKALEEKECLLVLDDFWHFKDFGAAVGFFMRMVNPCGRILLSTRFRDVAKQFGASTVLVEDLDDTTASDLFDKWCGFKAEGKEQESLKRKILKLCSNLALAVCIAGSNVKRIAESKGMVDGLRKVLGTLQGNLDMLSELDHLGGDRKLNAAMQTSIDSITVEGHKNGYECLAVLNNKTRIPSRALEALWGISARDVEDRVDLYANCSLVTYKIPAEDAPRTSFYVIFHDRHLEYARYCWRLKMLEGGRKCACWEEDEGVVRLHGKLVDRYRKMCREVHRREWWEEEVLNDGYFHENFAYHLAKSGRLGNLLTVMLDYRWIAIRCKRQEITELLEDFELTLANLKSCEKENDLEQKVSEELCAGSGELHTAVGAIITCGSAVNALRLVKAILGANQGALWGREDELPFQLVGRLRACSSGNALIEKLIEGARQHEERPWLCPMTQCFKLPMSGVFRVLRSSVLSIAICQKMRYLFSCGTADGSLHVWNWNTGRCRWSQRAHAHPVWSLAMTKDSSVVVSGSADNTARLWDMESGECKSVLRGHKGWVISVAVTEDGSVVVSGSEDKTIRLWNVKRGDCKSVLRGHNGWVTSVALAEDESVVVSGSDDTTIRLWNMENGECKSVLRGHEDVVSSVAVTEDGGVAVSGSWDKTVRLWNLENGDCKSVLRGHEGWVRSVAVTEDGDIAVSGSADRTVRLWNVESGACESVLRGHKDWVKSVAVTEDGSFIVSGSEDKRVRLWSVEKGDLKSVLRGHEGWVTSVAMSKDGVIVVSGSDDETVRLWSVERGECKSVFRGHGDVVSSVAVTEDGGVAVSGSWDKTVRLWNLENGDCKSVLRGHEGWVSSVAVTEDRSFVVSGSWDNTVRLWSVRNGGCKSVLRGHENVVSSVALAEDGDVVVSGSLDKTVRVWNLENGEHQSVFRGHEDWVNSVAVTKDGAGVVSGSNDKTVRLWNVRREECKSVLRGHEGGVTSVAVTDDGGVVVSSSEDKTVRLWNVESGKCCKRVGWNSSCEFGSRDILRWARSVGLVRQRSEAEFGGSGNFSLLSGGCEIQVESEAVRITRNGDAGIVMSATFESSRVLQSAFCAKFKGSRRVVVVGPYMFVLEIMNLERLHEGIGLINEEGGG